MSPAMLPKGVFGLTAILKMSHWTMTVKAGGAAMTRNVRRLL